MTSFASICMRLCCAVPLLALCACQKQADAPVSKPLVWVTKVQADQSGHSRVFPAVLQPRAESAVGFQVGGRITMRMVEAGQHVKAGQTLAQLSTDDLLTGVQSAKQQVAAAEAELQQLQMDEARLSRLSADGTTPAAELERQRTRVRAAQARLEGARQGERLAQNRLMYATLKAPFDGVITQVMADTGQVVAEGQPMLTVARASEIEAEADVPEDLVSQMRDAVATLHLPGVAGAPAFALKLREVSPMAAGPGRQVKVRYALASDDAKWGAMLRWGQTAEVHWQQTSAKRTVALPTGAIVKRDGSAHVWRVSEPDGRLVKQNVTIVGYTTDGVIISGLDDSTPVVSAGAQKLVAGMVVKTRERTATHLDLNTPRAGGL